jgi:16S rRNA (uracil1498-N3)-methyltransferase
VSPPVFLVEAARLRADRVRLDGPEGRHAATVRRLTPGERVDLVDGAGLLAECVVAAAGRDVLDVDVLVRRQLAPPAPRLVVVQALPKGERGELAVQTLTEVGVDVVVPWTAARCVTRWHGERGAKGLARWRAAAREATKQSRRAWLPDVRDPASTAEIAALLRVAALAVVLREQGGEPLATVDVPATGDVVVVVGPEGGVSPEELVAFTAAGASAYRLGPTVLRTSTAGVAALAVLSARSGRWT